MTEAAQLPAKKRRQRVPTRARSIFDPHPTLYTPPRRGGAFDVPRVVAFAQRFLATGASEATPWDAAYAVGLSPDEAIRVLAELGAGLSYLQDRLVARIPKQRLSLIIHRVPGFVQERAWPECGDYGVWTVYMVRARNGLLLGPLISLLPTAAEAGAVEWTATRFRASAAERRIRCPDEKPITCRRGGGGAGVEEMLEDEPGDTTWTALGAVWVIDEVTAEHHRSAGTLFGALALRTAVHSFTGSKPPGLLLDCVRRPWTVEALVRAALDIPTCAQLLQEDRLSQPDVTGWQLLATVFADEQAEKWGSPRARNAKYTEAERRQMVRILLTAQQEAGGGVFDRDVARALRLDTHTLRGCVEEYGKEVAVDMGLAESEPVDVATLEPLRMPGGISLPVATLDHITGDRAAALASLDAAMTAAQQKERA